MPGAAPGFPEREDEITKPLNLNYKTANIRVKDGKCERVSSPLRVCLLRFIFTIYEKSNEENLELRLIQ